jgi:CHAD domain-containing protein
MAKAKEIIGLDCAAPVLERAAEVLRVRFDEVVNLRGAALDFSDIEGVHSMRVATEAVRSALRDYTPFMSESSAETLEKRVETTRLTRSAQSATKTWRLSRSKRCKMKRKTKPSKKASED